MKTKLTVYSTHTETREFKFWNQELRELLHLPKRSGKFTEAMLLDDGGRLTLTFTQKRHRRTAVN